MIVVSTSSRLVEARIYHFSAKGAKVYARVDACMASMRARETNASLRAVRACVRARQFALEGHAGHRFSSADYIPAGGAFLAKRPPRIQRSAASVMTSFGGT